MRFLLVCLGGAAGSGARYLVGGWAASAFGPTFPAGTLIVNAVTEERMQRLEAIVEEMVEEGLVTLEKVRVVKYAPGSRPPSDRKA